MPRALSTDEPLRPDLEWLLALVARGQLDVGIAVALPWARAPEAVRMLLDRAVAGKVVLGVS